jgi:hypothetical protein
MQFIGQIEVRWHNTFLFYREIGNIDGFCVLPGG